MFQNRLLKMWKHYSKLAKRQEVACFRFYDHDLPEFPFAIEWYDGAVHAAEYKRRHGMEDTEHEAWLQACREVIATVLEMPQENIFMKQRQRKAGRQGQYEKFDEQKTERIVPEGGLKFIINLTDYLDTGLFLDHRITRNMVREQSEGKRVLNLFCYTGSFSVYAAHGGARSVTSVDLSKTYINWAKRNMQYNKLYKDDKHEFVHADVMEVINDLPANTFDLVVCDPPTFSNSKRMEETFDVQRDHVMLLKKLLKALTVDGKIFFSNNYRDFQIDRDAIPAALVKDITGATTPFDFQGRLNRACFLIEP
ncbi:MAG TPA: class I SAM-dependent methyltransferase [Flavipsychrobacter sp.]|nr:class I SAM-dependent methyltransferase [Flavipsychrobacter sp.]